mmetsp:Transcript_14512/g.42343  ORF Transcript_14512/g.42343 Transcript_14512/m.42343 type:complete len:141 (-) Transcript_14512:133-555(-)
MAKQSATAADGACPPQPELSKKRSRAKAVKSKRLDSTPNLATESTTKASAASASRSAASGEDQRKRKREVNKRKSEEAALEKLVGDLMEGQPGISAPKTVPLRFLSRHRSVAWQWTVRGKLCYPIPIGSSRPLSPFSSEA